MKIVNKAEALGAAEIFPQSSLADDELASTLGVYRRTVASRYRSVVSDDILTEIPAGELRVSPKMDGELWFLVSTEGEICVVSPTGRVITLGDAERPEMVCGRCGALAPSSIPPFLVLRLLLLL